MTLEELQVQIKGETKDLDRALDRTKKNTADTARTVDKALENMGGGAGSKALKRIQEMLKKVRSLRDELKIMNQKTRLESGAFRPTKQYLELQKQIRGTTRELDNLMKRQAAMNQFSSKPTANYAEIKAEYEQVNAEFDKLLDKEEAMKNFDRSNAGIKQLWDDLQDKIAETAARLGDYEAIMADLEATGDAFLPNEKWEQLQKEIEGATEKLKGYKAAEEKMLLSGGAAEKPDRGQKGDGFLGKVGKKIRDIGKHARAAKGPLDSFFGGLRGIWNIAKMFVIGSGIMGWINATKQGFSNLAAYSSSTRGSLESLKSSLSTLKNAFATAFAPILDVVAPVLSKVIDWCTAAATAVAHLFSALTGKSVTVVARKATSGIDGVGSSAGKAAGAVDELNRSLMGFDQINKLDSGSGGGGGGGGGGGTGGAGDMFDTVEISSEAMSLADAIKEAWANADFTEIGEMVGAKLNEALLSIPWDAIQSTTRKIAKSIATFLNGFISEADWKLVGKTIAEAINTAIYFSETFVTTFNWGEFGTAIADTIIGAVRNVDWAALAKTVGGLVGGLSKALWEALKELGAEIMPGFEEGIWEGIKGIGAWIRDNIFKPFIEGFKTAFGISSPSTVMAEMGGYMIDGLLKGLGDKVSSIIEWFKDLPSKIISTVGEIKLKVVAGLDNLDGIEALKKAWDSLKGSTKTFTAKAKTSGESALKKLSDAWGKIKDGTHTKNVIAKATATGADALKKVSDAWSKISSKTKTLKVKLQGVWEGISSKVKKLLGLESGGIYMGGTWKPITAAAGGGSFSQGQLFVAREAGPEMVGTIGGHSAVINNDQIVASVSDGVYKAVLAAMSGRGEGKTTVVLQGDAGQLFRVIKTQAENYTRSTGRAAFPV